MTAYEILDFEPAHDERVRALIQAILRDEFQIERDDPELKDIEGVYAPPANRFLVAMIEGEIVGSGAIHRLTETACELKWLYVRHDHRREGLATTIVGKLLPIVQEQGYKQILLEIRPEMEPFTHIYRRYGFREVPAGVEPPRPGRFMAIILP